MATNEVFKDGKQLSITPSDGGATSGAPGICGDFGFVAETDARTDGTVSVKRTGVFKLSAKGVNGAGNSAVAVGDTIYYVSADTPKLSKKTTGIKFGYALEAITSGSTATIKVLLA